MPGAKSEAERQSLIDEIIQSGQELARAVHTQRALVWLQIDISVPQMKALLFLYLEGAASMARIAGALGVKLPTVTGIVDRLVERGLVKREDSPQDRRVVLASLTEGGKHLMDRQWQAGWLEISELLQEASADELQSILQGMISWRDVLRRAPARQMGWEQAFEPVLPGAPAEASKPKLLYTSGGGKQKRWHRSTGGPGLRGSSS